MFVLIHVTVALSIGVIFDTVVSLLDAVEGEAITFSRSLIDMLRMFGNWTGHTQDL